MGFKLANVNGKSSLIYGESYYDINTISQGKISSDPSEVLDSLNDLHETHLSHASIFSVIFSQLIVLAKILAQEVFPTPLGPQNKNDWASWLDFIAFFKVDVIDDWPTTESKVVGLYFLAETIKSLIYKN